MELNEICGLMGSLGCLSQILGQTWMSDYLQMWLVGNDFHGILHACEHFWRR